MAQETLNFFAKELREQSYNFDKFLLSKNAMTPDKKIRFFEDEELQNKYYSRYIGGTPYAMELVVNKSHRACPFEFWSDLKSKSYDIVSRLCFEDDIAMQKATGKTHNERALEEIAKQKSLQSEFLKSSETLADKMRVKHTPEEELLSNW